MGVNCHKLQRPLPGAKIPHSELDFTSPPVYVPGQRIKNNIVKKGRGDYTNRQIVTRAILMGKGSIIELLL